MSKLIYLASPYGHDKPPELRQQRYEQAQKAEARMMNDGMMVYSPIVHRHPGAVLGLYPTGWEYWQHFDELILSRCDDLCVLRIEGWEESGGVKAEIEIAMRLGLRIYAYDPISDQVVSLFMESATDV